MKKMMELISYIFPIIGSIIMISQAKWVLLELSHELFGVIITILLLMIALAVCWLKKVDEDWLEKIFIMGIISLSFIFISGESSIPFMIISTTMGIIVGISAIYIKYKFSFIDSKEKEQKYYPEIFDIKWYGWMLLPKVRNIKNEIASALSKNFEVDIHSLSSYFGMPLKKVMKNLSELKKEGKIDVNYRDGKTFVEVIKDEM